MTVFGEVCRSAQCAAFAVSNRLGISFAHKDFACARIVLGLFHGKQITIF